MIGPLESIKKLEVLVKQASEALQKTASENRALKEKLAHIEAEHKRAKEELREAKLTLARHERLKARLVKLSEKLERVS
jgi:chromosome condensin MukBEF ATPase and DNA-binding subunit MukB